MLHCREIERRYLAAVSVAAEVPVRGRERELLVAHRIIRRAAAGTAAGIVVEGDPGIGKTAILDAIARLAAIAGFVVHLGHAEEWEISRPFGALVEALGDTVADLSTPDLDEGALDGAHHRAIDRVVEVVEVQALRRPLALVLDDIQWADQATLIAVAAIMRRLVDLPILIVLAHRALASPNPAVTGLVAAGGETLRLGPLDDDAIAAVIAEHLGVTAIGPRLRRQLAAAGGNAFFAIELVRVLRAEGQVATRGDVADASTVTAPPSLRLVVLRHLSFLSSGALDVLRLASVLGPSFALDDLIAFTAEPLVALLPRLKELEAAGVLSFDDEQAVEFRHDVVRETVYGDVAPAIRTSLHRQAWTDLAARGAPALHVAHHVARAAGALDSDAARWLLRAADDAAAHDPGTAIDLLRRVVRDGENDVVSNASAELAMLLARAGSTTEAEQVARAALMTESGHPRRHEITLALVHAHFAQGRWRDVIAVADDALRVGIDDATAARLLAQMAMAKIWMGDLDAAASTAADALARAEAIGDDIARSLSFAHLSVVAANRGRFVEAVELATRGVDTASALAPIDRVQPRIALGMAHVAAGALARGRDALGDARRLGEAAGSQWDLPLHHTMLALPSYFLGDWDTAVAEAETGLTLAAESGAHHGDVTAHCVIALVAAHRADVTRAADELARAMDLTRSGPQWGQGLLVCARADLSLLRGDVAQACDLLERAWQLGLEAGAVELLILIGPDLVRGALRREDATTARRVAVELDAATRVVNADHAAAAALVATASVEHDPDGALAAVDRYRRCGRTPDVARSCGVAGVVLAGRGRRGDAQRMFADAMTIYGDLGAVADLAETRRQMVEAGLEAPARRRPARPTFGWESLTSTELDVAKLAAEGLTNPAIGERMFISRRTVQTHLSHIFVKLGIASRVELAAEFVRRSV